MKFRITLAVGLAGITLITAGAAAAPPPQVRIVEADAVVSDTVGTEQFTLADDGFVFERFGNPRRVVFDGDAEGRRVRVTPFDQPALWLRCADLAPIREYCPAARPAPLMTAQQAAAAAQERERQSETQRVRVAPRAAAAAPRRARMGAVRGAPPPDDQAAGPASRLPRCPGDPRCP